MCLSSIDYDKTPNGLRYPLVGGTRQRHFAGTNSTPCKLPENAPTPTSRVHAVLGGSHEGIYPKDRMHTIAYYRKSS